MNWYEFCEFPDVWKDSVFKDQFENKERSKQEKIEVIIGVLTSLQDLLELLTAGVVGGIRNRKPQQYFRNNVKPTPNLAETPP